MKMYIQIVTGMAIFGALYVASNRSLAANILWGIANPMLVFFNAVNGQIEQAIMFSVFTIIALYGVYNLIYVQGLTWYDTDEWYLFKKREPKQLSLPDKAR